MISTITINEILRDQTFDIIGGSAGLLLILHHVQRSFEKKPTYTTAIEKIKEQRIAAIQALMNGITAYDSGSAWLASGENEPLLGFAHGTAGILSALSETLYHYPELHEFSDEINLLITNGCKYESSKENVGSFIDCCFDLPPESSINRSWCHGLSGFGLSKLALSKQYPGKLNSDCYIGKVIALFLSREQPQNLDSYCCGEAGEIDFLLEAMKQ